MKYFKNIKNILKNNKSLRYWYRCYKYRNMPQSYNAIPNDEKSYEFFHFHSGGRMHKDKNVYLIEIDGGSSGFFAIYRHILQSLYICERFNFEPYIRIYNSYYNDETDSNIFDSFFIQPTGWTEKEAYNSYNIIDYNYNHMMWMENKQKLNETIMAGYEVNEEFICCAAKINRKYMVIKPDIKNKFYSDIQAIIKHKKTVALHYRGNAFNIGFIGHPVALHIEDYYKYIDKCLQNGYEQIFIATDEMKIIKKLEQRYPGLVCYYKDVSRSVNGIDIHIQKSNRKNNGYKMAFEVMRDMLTISYCDALICGNSQVTIAARIQKKSDMEEFEYLKIIDKGVYSKDNHKAIKKYFNRKEIRKNNPLI